MSDGRALRESSFLWIRDILIGDAASWRPPGAIQGALATLAQRQQVAGILDEKLATRLEQLDLDLHLAGVLQAAAFEQWRTSQRLRFALPALHGALHEAGVEAILLKGPDLAERFHGDLAARPYSDLDVLVRPRDLSAATAALCRDGWRLASPRLDGGPWRRVLRRGTHHVELRREGVPVELHHGLRVHPTLAIDCESLFEESFRRDVAGRRWRVLSDEHTLLTALLGLHADVGLGTATLRSLLDVDRIVGALDGATDWPRFFQRRRPEGTLGICVNALALTARLLDGERRSPRLLAALEEPPARELRLAPLAASPAREFLMLFDTVSGTRSSDYGCLLRAKLWTLRQYDRPLTVSLLHWLATLPLRLLATGRSFENLRHRRRLRREQAR